MSDAADLRRIVGAMTERPWNVGPDNDPNDGEIEDEHKAVARVQRAPVAGNTLAIVALANHADALVGLVEECKRCEDNLPPFVRVALARVEAVK